MGITAVDTLRQILKELKETNRLLQIIANQTGGRVWPPQPPPPR